MRSPAEASAAILERVSAIGDRELAPISRCDGRVLARDVVADLDLPPFEKSAVDGFAVRSSDFAKAPEAGREPVLHILGESRAGAPFGGEVAPGACVAIYTGAEVPRGADAIVMVEQSTVEGSSVRLRGPAGAGQHVCPRGQDVRRGTIVIVAGTRLRPAHLSVLASVGCDPVEVWRRPRACVVTTGDELVAPSVVPGPGQIREGNTLQLAALLERHQASVDNLGVVRDSPRELERRLAEAFEAHDVVVTTGGVSVGKYDFVGAALQAIGVEPVLHKIAMKPGKPLWFGVRGGVPVFALPGNPVSCFVGCELFVGPALSKMSNAIDDPLLARIRVARWLGEDLEPNPREQYIPSRVQATDPDSDGVTPVPWNGSADVVGLARADALAIVAANTPVARGDRVRYRLLP